MTSDPAQARLEEIGRLVREARTRHGWNQDAFAHHAGFHRAYIGMIENGKKDLRISTLYRLAEALGVPVTSLLP
jgi:transcriptional regulator with XRE-family HTH domain